MKQKYTSEKTSINTTRLPAIYSKLNMQKLKGKIIFDFGCGNYKTVNMIKTFLSKFDIELIAYDLFNLSEADNCYALERAHEADLFVCSNVLNVIFENQIVQQIISTIVSFSNFNQSELKPIFFKIYEGNKSSIGKETLKNAWQRNELTNNYISNFNWNIPVSKYKGFIINTTAKQFLL